MLGLVSTLAHLEFSSDLLAAISIVTSVILGEYLADTPAEVLKSYGGQAVRYWGEFTIERL